MIERSLTGARPGASRFGAPSVEPEPRHEVEFACSQGHHCTVVFTEHAEIPASWPCPRCGTDALRTGDGLLTETPARRHWDLLRQRRSLPDLEQLLAERLKLLHEGEKSPSGTHPRLGSA